MGAVDTVLVDIDEIARRVFLSGGTVMAVRRDDVPGGGSAAAILRYAI